MHCNRRSDRAGNHAAHRQPGAVSEYGGLRHARARTAWRDHSLRVGQIPLESKARIAVIDTVSRRAQRSAFLTHRAVCTAHSLRAFVRRSKLRLPTSALGQKWTSEHAQSMSALPPCVDGSELARRIFTLQVWSVHPCVRPHMMVSPSRANQADRDPRWALASAGSPANLTSGGGEPRPLSHIRDERAPRERHHSV